jgi:hypothetical protein
MKHAARSEAKCIERNEVEKESRGRAKPTEALSGVERKLVRAMCINKRSLRGAY